MAADDEQRSLAMIEAGELPLNAQRRLAMMTADACHTSDLSTAEFAAVRSVGFDAVGQVMGSCVYQIGYRGNWSCVGDAQPAAAGPYLTPYRSRSQIVMRPDDYSVAGPTEASLRAARSRALYRMSQETAALGGDGVVGVRLTMSPFLGASNCWEFQAIGTAVRARRRPADEPRDPFRSALSGQDFARLLRSGWVPVDLAMGVACVVRHVDYSTWQSMRLTASNGEIPGLTTLVHAARGRARDLLASEVAAQHGDGCVIHSSTLQVRERECWTFENQKDYLADVVQIATSVARITRRPRPTADPPTLAILRLDRSGRLDLRDRAQLYHTEDEGSA